MSHMPDMLYDDVESEMTTVNEEAARRLMEQYNAAFFSVECLGDRFPHGAIYDRSTGKKIGGWVSLSSSSLSVSEILVDVH